MIRRRVVVKGRVQGVFFRARCREEARRLGLSGWVRNRSDGAVEAVFEGEPMEVEEMLAWMQHGPPRARVTDRDVTEESVEGEIGFWVR